MLTRHPTAHKHATQHTQHFTTNIEKHNISRVSRACKHISQLKGILTHTPPPSHPYPHTCSHTHKCSPDTPQHTNMPHNTHNISPQTSRNTTFHVSHGHANTFHNLKAYSPTHPHTLTPTHTLALTPINAHQTPHSTQTCHTTHTTFHHKHRETQHFTCLMGMQTHFT